MFHEGLPIAIKAVFSPSFSSFLINWLFEARPNGIIRNVPTTSEALYLLPCPWAGEKFGNFFKEDALPLAQELVFVPRHRTLLSSKLYGPMMRHASSGRAMQSTQQRISMRVGYRFKRVLARARTL